MKMIRLIGICLALALSIWSCTGGAHHEMGAEAADSMGISPLIGSMVCDSALYGRAGDFGMSTFCLICDDGDTVLVTRDDHTGKMGKWYGRLQPGDRYAMMTTDGGEALMEAVNLTLLDGFLDNYRIQNCRLTIFTDDGHAEGCDIMVLCDDSLVVRTAEGVRKFYGDGYRNGSR